MFPLFLFPFLRIATLNVNGLCSVRKQVKLHSFISYNKIDILLIQEHNAKHLNSLDFLSTHYKFVFNPTIDLKGGTAIMVNKKLDIEMSYEYLHPSSRICKVTMLFQNYRFNLICIYAHSGNKFNTEREVFFEYELLPLIQNCPQKAIIGGDWNCIISDRDSSNPKNSNFSKTFKDIVSNLQFKDVHNMSVKIPEYTYVKANYACRLDRVYAADCAKGARSSKTVPVSFSDHSCFYFDLYFDHMFVLGKGYWKLNCSILKESGVKEDFAILWNKLKLEQHRFKTVLDWWDSYVKTKIKEFYINVCKVKSNFKYNMLNILENNLRKLYENAHVTGSPKINEIKEIKEKI